MSAESGPARWQRQLSWCALPSLALLYELPSLELPEPVRPTGELFALLCAWLLSLGLKGPLRWGARLALAVCATALVVMRIDRIVFLRFMGEEPLFYDQLFMMRHLFVLVGDAWSFRVGAAMLGVVAAIVLLFVAVRLLLRLAASAVAGGAPNSARKITLATAGLLVAGSFVPVGSARAVRWVTPDALSNLEHSKRIYRSVQQQVASSPYRGYERIALSRKPDVYLIFIESYGRVITQRSFMRRAWTRQVKGMEETLSKAGWHMVSGFSRAPVMGGRSWLAEGTILMGAHVAYEAVFHHLVNQIERVPNLVSFLAHHGYHTLLLAPADRKRPGVEEANYYGYERYVRFNELGYHGPKFGWGIVPDQYSLGFTEEHVLRSAAQPLFFDYHMVSSHAPWEDIPRLVPEWRSLNEMRGERNDDTLGNSTLMRLQRYVHKRRRFASQGQFTNDLGRNYQATIMYDLDLLEGYLAHLERDALVIVMGDHQPPFMAVETRNFDTPVHVFARDPDLLQELSERGFRPGLWLSSDASTAVQHEGLFSLLARTLVRCCGKPEQLPEYRRDGVPLE